MADYCCALKKSSNVSLFFWWCQSQFHLHHTVFYVAPWCDNIWLLQLKILSNRSVGVWFYSTPREVREKWPRTPTVRSTTTIVAHWTLIQNLTKRWFKNCSKMILSLKIYLIGALIFRYPSKRRVQIILFAFDIGCKRRACLRLWVSYQRAICKLRADTYDTSDCCSNA